MNETPQTPQTPKPSGCGCGGITKIGCGGIVLALVGLFLYGTLLERQEKSEKERQERKTAEELEQVQRELEDFGRQRAPDLIASMNQLTAQEADLQDRCEKLRAILVRVQKDPAQDADYLKWTECMADTTEAIATLRNDLTDAYVVYQKYVLTPDDKTLEQSLKTALDNGKRAAAGATERYRQLTSEINR